ncbi:MAG: hypothetical protein ACQGQO_07530 [Sphaerochaetaceae bacterium]
MTNEKSKLRKIKIISNSIGFGPFPEPDEEVEQHLSINSHGRVFVSSYAFGDGCKYRKIRSRYFKIKLQNAASILDSIHCFFSNCEDFVDALDVGTWEAFLEFEDGTSSRFTGPLTSDCNKELDTISDLIRSSFEMPDLLAFDGNERKGRIERITVDYHNLQKVSELTLDYAEHLCIDRSSEELVFDQIFGTGCIISKKYHVEDGISSLLDDQDPEELVACTDCKVQDPLNTKTYKITIDCLNEDQRVISGTFDRNGLPDGFADFANDVVSFTEFYSNLEMFNPSVLRRKNELIFCKVQFGRYGSSYSYLTDDESLKAGDWVVVPVGSSGSESIGKIESIEYCTAEDAPYPIDAIKKIIRKAEAKVKASQEECTVMRSEPLPDISADDWRCKLEEDFSEKNLADSLAAVWNETGWLCDEDNSEEEEQRYESWWELQMELVNKAADILQCKVDVPYAKLIEPLMNRNGYRLSTGWWISD